MRYVFLLCVLLIVTCSQALAFHDLRLATEATYPPFEYMTADGKIKGFDIDVVNAVCQRLNSKCTISHQPWESLIPSLQLGKFDVIFGALNVTEERKQQVDFTETYYRTTASFVAPVADNLEISAAGLKGKHVGVQEGTTMAAYLNSTFEHEVKVATYASQESAFLDLMAGRIDAVLGDTPIMVNWVHVLGDDNYDLVGEPIESEQFFGEGIALAIKKGQPELLRQLNHAIHSLKTDGALEKIAEKHFGHN